jgi:hypothetical protein
VNKKEVKQIADEEVHKHERNMHGRTTKLAKGGVTTQGMKAHGRNIARVMNQRSRGR